MENSSGVARDWLYVDHFAAGHGLRRGIGARSSKLEQWLGAYPARGRWNGHHPLRGIGALFLCHFGRGFDSVGDWIWRFDYYLFGHVPGSWSAEIWSPGCAATQKTQKETAIKVNEIGFSKGEMNGFRYCFVNS